MRSSSKSKMKVTIKDSNVTDANIGSHNTSSRTTTYVSTSGDTLVSVKKAVLQEFLAELPKLQEASAKAGLLPDAEPKLADIQRELEKPVPDKAELEHRGNWFKEKLPQVGEWLGQNVIAPVLTALVKAHT